MRRIVISVLIGLAIGALGASPAAAAPSLLPGGTYAYTDHRPLVDPIFGSGATGFGVTVGAQVFDGIDNGVDNLVARTVTPSNAGFPGGTGPYSLSFIYWISAGDEAEWGEHFQLGVGDLGNVTGTYHFYFENNLAETLDVDSHPLNSGNLRQLAMPEDITFTGPALTPTLSWTDPNGSAVFGGNEFHNYRLRIFNATTGQRIYYSPTSSSSPSVTVPSGILSFGESYWFRPEIRDIDDEDVVRPPPMTGSSRTARLPTPPTHPSPSPALCSSWVQGSWVRRAMGGGEGGEGSDYRRRKPKTARPAVRKVNHPETTHMNVLGSGLLVAAGWRRKMGGMKR